MWSENVEKGVLSIARVEQPFFKIFTLLEVGMRKSTGAEKTQGNERDQQAIACFYFV
jgi:hypothetical protein